MSVAFASNQMAHAEVRLNRLLAEAHAAREVLEFDMPHDDMPAHRMNTSDLAGGGSSSAVSAGFRRLLVAGVAHEPL